jgi:predicted esterase
MPDEKRPTVETKHFTIERQVRYATLGDPGEAVTQVWFVLHGFGQLAPRFLRYFRPLADGRRILIAPEGLHRYYVKRATKRGGASWMTAEDRLTDIDDYVAYLDRLYTHVFESIERDSVQVAALGFSQGVHTLCRWIAFGEPRIDRAILWGATVPPDLDLDAHGHRLGEARLQLVVGEEDHLFTPEAVRAYHDRLDAHGVQFEAIPYPGGHALDIEVLRGLAEEVV